MKSETLLKILYFVTSLIILDGIILIVMGSNLVVSLGIFFSILFTFLVSIFNSDLFTRKSFLFTQNTSRSEFNMEEFENILHKINHETKRSLKDAEDVKKQINILRNNVQGKFVGNIKSHKYHTRECRFSKKMDDSHKVLLKNKQIAKRKGFMPGRCIK